jgi:DNA adenine methylase
MMDEGRKIEQEDRCTCQFCGEEYEESMDHEEAGFWCDECDGYTQFEPLKIDRYSLLLETGKPPVTKAKTEDIKLNRRMSPLRYPGGKSKMIGSIYNTLTDNHKRLFVEPFAGGGSVGLSLLDAGVVQQLVLNDIDFGIYSLFKCAIDDCEWLTDRIRTLSLSQTDFYAYRDVVSSKYKDCDYRSAGLALLVTNRLAYSGICKANALGGKNGSQEELLSRWKPAELIKRIQKINSMKDKIVLLNQDALEVIEEYYWQNNTTLFIDAPYYEKGHQLYTHYFQEQDHIELSSLLDSLYRGFQCADLIVTYDNHHFIREIYTYPVVKDVDSSYSI